MTESNMADPETTGNRKHQGAMAVAISVIAIAFSAYHILYISGVLSRMQVFLFPPQHLAAHLGILIALVFLLIPAAKGMSREKTPWYDIFLALFGLGWNAYIIINFDSLLLRTSMAIDLNTVELISAWFFFLVLFEAARRTMGIIVAVLGAIAVTYPLIANQLSGLFIGPVFTPDRIARSVGMFPDGIFGPILNISATIVFSFLLFAQFLNISGASQWFIDIARASLGHVRGGPAKVAVVASSLMGTIQGTAVGNIVTTGVITIPLMKSTGYRPHVAGAVEAAASNGGQIMPPIMGITAFIMIDFLGISYDKIVIAAILPAVVYYVALFFAVDFEAAKAGLVGIPRSELPSIRSTLSRGWQFMIPLAALIYFLLVERYSPQYSALLALVVLILTSIVLSFFRVGITGTLNRFPAAVKLVALALKNTAIAMMMVGVICALAATIVESVELTGLSHRLSFLLVQVAGGSLLVMLVLTAVVCVILGMGMPTSAAYVILATLATPAIIKMGVPDLAAHFFVFYFGVAAIITPPVCPGSFVAASIANAPPMKTAITAARLGVASFAVPFVFVYNQGLLMQGSITSIALIAGTTLIAVIALAAGLGGYLLRPINYGWRIPLIVGALLIIHPAFITTAFGIGIIALLVLYEIIRSRLRSSQS
ncbi:TRAP transporter permease [Chloroflexota bacterium]